MLINIPEHIVEIKSKAFTDNVAVVDYYLPATIKKIAVDSFPKGSTFIVDASSYAELWCSENGFGYSIKGQEDDLSWLTEGLSSEPDNQYSELLEIAKETMAEYIGEPYVLIDTSSVDAFCQSFALIEGFGALNVNSVNDCLAIGDPNPEWAYYICEMIFAGEMF